MKQSRQFAADGLSFSETEMVPVNARGTALGQYNHRSKYSDREVSQVIEMYESGFAIFEVARTMEMPKSTVWAIVHGLIRSQVPVDWKRRKKRSA